MKALLATLALGAFFVIVTGTSLPPVVATHFTAGGTANGFMPRGTYVGFTLALLVGLPMLIALASNVTNALPVRFINLPHREYWLAPERQEETLDYLAGQGRRLGLISALFLCFVHWLVVEANGHTPPLFPESRFYVGAVVFLVALTAWMIAFVTHFQRRP